MVQDLATQWIQSCPCKTKEPNEVPGASKETKSHLHLHFLGIGQIDLSWNHCTSTPHRSETNGIAERVVRRIEEGTSAVLLQSGLDEKWWADSMECYCYLRNIQDLLSDGKTPFEGRDLPEWLEEIKENHVNDSVPEHRDAPSSYHVSLSEPRAKVVSG